MHVADLTKAEHLHHAYIVVGDPRAGSGQVVALLEKRGVATKGNPDLLKFDYSEMGVDDARTLASYAFLKSVGAGKYFIITFDRANDAAQNALLKVVEEAPGNTHFFFCTETLGGILSTLQSRCIAVRGDASKTDPEASPLGAGFLKAGYAERLSQVEKLVAASQKTQDRGPVRAFVRSLIAEAHMAHTTPAALRTLLQAERHLRLSGASPKLILSHLAVTLDPIP
ncbi:MAG: hypothetical protein AAB955_01985 [Patescibacteria group bacterium]